MIVAGKTASTPVRRNVLRHRVWTWSYANKWKEDPDICSKGDTIIHAGKELGNSQAKHEYGNIHRLRKSAYQVWPPKDSDLDWKPIRLTVDRRKDAGKAGQSTTKDSVFFGWAVIPHAERETLSTTFTIQDMKWILSAIPLDKGWYECSEPSPGGPGVAQHLAKRLNDFDIFNRGVVGPGKDADFVTKRVFECGNKSRYRYDPDTEDDEVLNNTSDAKKGFYVFGARGGIEGIWTHREILETIVRGYANRAANLPLTSKGFRLKFTILNGELLDTAVWPPTKDRGAELITKKKYEEIDLPRNCLDAIDHVIRLAGDFSWRLKCLDLSEEDNGHEWGIEIFDKSDPSMMTRALALVSDMTGGIIRLGRGVNLDSANVQFGPQVGPVNLDKSSTINRIVLLGARRRFVTTLAPWRRDHAGTPSLVPGWTDTDQANMESDLDDAPEHDELKNKDLNEKYRDVFRKFVVPDADNNDGAVFNYGAVESLRDPAENKRRRMFPKFTQTKGPNGWTETRDDTRYPPAFVNGLLNFSLYPKILSAKLPWKEAFDYGSAGTPKDPPEVVIYADDYQAKGQGEWAKPRMFSVNTHTGLLTVARELDGAVAIPPAKQMKGWETIENATGVIVDHFDKNLTDDTNSAMCDLSGHRGEAQDMADEDKLWPYDWSGDPDDEPDSTKVQGANYASWQTLAFTVCIEVEDRPCFILEDSDSINKGDPVRTVVIQSDAWRYDEAIEAMIDEGDAGVPATILGEYGDPPYVIRDDYQKMVAYGTRLFRKLRQVKREGVVTYRNCLDFSLTEGDYILEVRRGGPSYVSQKLYSPIMSIIHNLDENTTTYKTQYDAGENMEEVQAT
jgi:hypothetical protein